MTFDIQPMGQGTNGPMDQWTKEPMDQGTNGRMDQWANDSMDKKLLQPYEKKNILDHWNIGRLDDLNISKFALIQHLLTSIALILFKRLS